MHPLLDDSSPRTLWRWSLAAGLLSLAFSAVWHSVWPVTPDGAHYLAIADAWQSGRGLVDPIGYVTHVAPRTALHWPPLVPFMLAALHALGLSWIVSFRALSVLSTAVAVTCTARSAVGVLRGPARVAAVLWLASTPMLTWYAQMASSEAASLALIAASLCVLARCTEKPSATTGAALGLLSAMAVASRWACVALAVPIAWRLVEMLRSKRAGAPTVAAGVTVGAAVVLVPLVLWRLRTGDGPRDPSSYTLPLLARDTVVAFVKSWVLTVFAGFALPALVALAARPGDDAGSREARARALVDHALFATAMLAMQLGASWRFRLDTIGNRLLLPATASVWLLSVLAASWWRDRRGERRPSLAVPAAAVAVLLSLGVHGMFMRRWRAQRAGREAVLAVLPALGRVPAGATVYTDLAELIPYRLDLRWERLQTEPNGDPISPWTLHLRCEDHAWWAASSADALASSARGADSTCAPGVCLHRAPCDAPRPLSPR